MAFKAISELPTLVNKLGTSTTALVSAGGEIIAILATIPKVFSGGEPSLKWEKTKLKIPKITLPVTSMSFPPSIIKTFPELKLDACHLDFSIFGSLLKAIMTALTMIVDAVINSIISALCEAVQMFMILVESTKQILGWLGDLINNIWSKVKDAYNETKKNKTNTISPELKALYDRIIKWMEEKMRILGGICTKLKEAVRKFFSAMGTVLEDIGAILLVFPKALAELPEDLNCLLKVATLVTK